MIRLATNKDIPRLVVMGKRFLRESSYEKFLTENPDRMEALCKQLIAIDGLVLIEKEGVPIGMLGFVIHDHFISGEKVAGEVFWWIEPEYRGAGLRLLKAVETMAKRAGAKYLQMIAPNDRVASFYRHFKYEFVEATYQRPL